MNNIEEGLRTPSKGPKPGSTSSPSNTARGGGGGGSAKKGIKNAKITNFFCKVNSPLNRNNSNSNHGSENDAQQPQSKEEELSVDNSSSSIKVPDSSVTTKIQNTTNKQEYVFIIPSSDDDTNVSTKGSTASRRRKAPSVNSGNSRSSDGLILTTNTNNELGLGPRKRNTKTALQNIEKHESVSNHETPSTPTRSSGRDSRSRDSLPEKRMKVADSPRSVSTFNQNSGQKTINRIQPTHLGSRTKTIDFQSVPSDLNMPRDQAMRLIEKFFLVKMPEDFFLFWEFAKTINHRKPCSAFSHAYLDWNLVGPYDVLSGLITDFHGFSKENLLRHCRYYYDPPEFQTVIAKKDKHMTHYGYFRDEPGQDKPIIVVNKAASGGVINECGDNLFTLLRTELDSSIALLSKSGSQEPPVTFSSSSSKTPRNGGKSSNESTSSSATATSKQSQLEKAKAKQELTIIRDKLIDFCSSHENISSESWSRTNTRKAKRCSKTLNNVGIVVPLDGDVGYRDLGVTDARLKTMLTRISDFKDDKIKCGLYKDLHQIINNTNMANDECDFGMGLELGLDLFFQGDPCYHKDVEFLLTNAYTLLDRTEFIEILKSHLEERKKGDQVSLLD